ncbi:hypothetical protein [Acidovorax sp. CF316]|uniref:hypothetical protein n=1 Tax=Acidovorax sp. CF316 TaxID=1144317 RepID=UPI0011B25146|nr:hypothetical protein [Acidovorax sp. CF316]
MISALRHIAVYVDEPTEGNFVWVLNERGRDGEWMELERAKSSSPTFKDAMAQGLWKLQSLVPDLNAGPRQPAATASAKPRENKPEKAPAIDDSSSAPRSAFGFGLAN